VTLDRPEALNAVDADLHRALAEVWSELSADAEARAVVLTGAGSAFSAGGDLDLVRELHDDPARRRHNLAEARRIVKELTDFRLPVVAAVNGPAVGLGCTVALLCDVVYIAESAYLCDPHVTIGVTAGDGGTVVWPLLTSLLRAKEYLLTGSRIQPAEAVQIGLANRVFPDGELLNAALAFADRLAALPPQAVQTTKQALNLHLARAAVGILDYAISCEYESLDTPEHRHIVGRIRHSPREEP
jgi:enoyl-CoA hydratase